MGWKRIFYSLWPRVEFFSQTIFFRPKSDFSNFRAENVDRFISIPGNGSDRYHQLLFSYLTFLSSDQNRTGNRIETEAAENEREIKNNVLKLDSKHVNFL